MVGTRCVRRVAGGFTLIEIVAAIVVMAIISIGVVDFITNSASSYSEAAVRNQVSASGRVVIDRIAMELRNALPESVRISPPNISGFPGDQCLEFMPIRAATTYIDPAFRPGGFKTSFTVVNFVPTQTGADHVFAVVYPTASSDLYSAGFGPGNTTAAIARVRVGDSNPLDGINEVTTHLAGDTATSYNHRFRRRSSVERIFLADAPVSYCVSGSKLFRYANYGFQAAQPRPVGSCSATPVVSCLPASTPNRVLITDQLDNSTLTGGANGQAFDQLAASRARNAVIQLELNFSQEGEVVRLNHEVLQQAAP